MKLTAFRECDIRGHYPDEVNEALMEAVGDAFGYKIIERGREGTDIPVVLVGGDARLTTASLKRGLIGGLIRHELRVADLGRVPTPVVYWAKARYEAAACAMVTASHNPPDWNGLKLMLGPFPPTQDDYRELAEAYHTYSRKSIHVQYAVETWDDCLTTYLKEFVTAFSSDKWLDLSVVVDAGNGCQAGVASHLIRKLDGMVHAIHDVVDGTFPDRHPDSAVPEHLCVLQETVRRTASDFGVAFDGDGDRLNVVDDCGRVLGAERLGMILLKHAFESGNGQTVVLDVKCSMQLERYISQFGFVPVRCKSGHAYMKRMMLERNAAFGIEVSGHLFWGCLEGRDDPLYTACCLGRILVQHKIKLSEWVDRLPVMYLTPDIRIPMEAPRIESVIERCLQGFDGARIETLDGVRLVWEDGYVLVRRSITEAKLTVRMEGENSDSLKRVANRFIRQFTDLERCITSAVERVLTYD